MQCAASNSLLSLLDSHELVGKVSSTCLSSLRLDTVCPGLDGLKPASCLIYCSGGWHLCCCTPKRSRGYTLSRDWLSRSGLKPASCLLCCLLGFHLSSNSCWSYIMFSRCLFNNCWTCLTCLGWTVSSPLPPATNTCIEILASETHWLWLYQV